MNELIGQIFATAHLVWRRRRYAALVAWVVCVAGWAFVSTMPDIFRSTAVVYIDTETILRPLLSGLAIEPNIQAEVALMERTLTSRPNLEKVARLTDLDLTTKSRAELEVLLERLRSRISVQNKQQNLFSISFEDASPKRARDVVSALLSIFVESNLGQSRQDMDTARRFIEEQIKLYETKLEESERRLADFKQQNMGLISVSKEGAFQVRLEQAQGALEQAQTDLKDAELRRSTLQRELSSVPQFFPSDASATGPPTNIEMQILQLETQLEDLLSRYTEQHPDVVQTRRRLEALRAQQQKEIAKAAEWAGGEKAGGGKAVGPSNPVYEQLKIQLVQEEAKIATLRNRVSEARTRLDQVQQEANRVPELEAELARLNRDYGVLLSRHQELVARREQERMSRAREVEAQDVKFRVLQAPEIPVRPSGPDRYLFLSFVLVVGLGSGAGFALLLGLSSDTFNNPNQLKEAFPFPVIGTVSRSEFVAQSFGAIVHSSIFWVFTAALLAAFSSLVLIEWKLGINRVVSGEVLSRLPSDWLRYLPRF